MYYIYNHTCLRILPSLITGVKIKDLLIAFFHLSRKFPLKRSMLLLFQHLHSLCLTCLSAIKEKEFLKALDSKEEKLEKHLIEVIIFNDCQIGSIWTVNLCCWGYIRQWIIAASSLVSNWYRGHMSSKFTKAYFKVKKIMMIMHVFN